MLSLRDAINKEITEQLVMDIGFDSVRTDDDTGCLIVRRADLIIDVERIVNALMRVILDNAA